MTAIEKVKAIQGILEVVQDGDFKTKSHAALDALIADAGHAELPEQSARFKTFIPWILDREGRYFEDDPHDSGGATHFGIDQASHPGVDIRNLTEAGAIAIYWKEWLEAGCENMQSPYAEVYFNCRVNMGLGRAKEFHASAQGNADKFLDLQEAKYRSLADNNRNLARYLKGWLNRTALLRERFGI